MQLQGAAKPQLQKQEWSQLTCKHLIFQCGDTKSAKYHPHKDSETVHCNTHFQVSNLESESRCSSLQTEKYFSPHHPPCHKQTNPKTEAVFFPKFVL